MSVIRQVQYKGLYAHLHFVIILGIYYGLTIMENGNAEIVNGVFLFYLIIGLIINAFFVILNLYEHLWLYFSVRVGFSIGMIMFIPFITLLFRISVMLLIALYIFEMIIRTPTKKIYYKTFFILITSIIWATGYILASSYGGISFDTVFILTGISLFIYGAFQMYTTIQEEAESCFTTQIKMYHKVEAQNEELLLSQERLRQMHNEMAQQKQDLEKTNQQLSRVTSEIYIQNELLRYISIALDIHELIDRVTDAMIGTTGVDSCSLILYDKNSNKYFYKMESILTDDFLQDLIQDTENGILSEYFQTKNVLLDNNVDKANYGFIHRRNVKSLAIIPLFSEEEVYGLLIVEHSLKNMFDDMNIQFFTGISTQITIAINNAHLFSKMETLATKDGLTGIYNRKYFIDHIESYIQTADKKQKPLSVALFDIDHFKSVNDKYGHTFGDQAIKLCAKIIEKMAKKHNGLAVRYGGEEFVLVLPNKDLKHSLSVVQEIHEQIKKAVLIYEEEGRFEEVFLNVSSGVSAYPEIAKNSQKLLIRADNAMYYSKKHGRGRITLDSKNLDKVI